MYDLSPLRAASSWTVSMDDRSTSAIGFDDVEDILFFVVPGCEIVGSDQDSALGLGAVGTVLGRENAYPRGRAGREGVGSGSAVARR